MIQPPHLLQKSPRPNRAPPHLLHQLRWIISLRWIAAAAVIIGAAADHLFLQWYAPSDTLIASLGLIILAYNLAFYSLLNSRFITNHPALKTRLYSFAWTQILVDLAALTALVTLTGNYQSPVRGFFVFHMVFASLLLPRLMAYAAALLAIVMVEGTLTATTGGGGQSVDPAQRALGLGWDLTLVTTVFLASVITQHLRRQRRRLSRQNRRIRAMSQRLRQHQQAMVQQEKMFAMGQLAAGVAHEVSNPLASMDGLLQLLERRPEKITPENLLRLREQIARINQIVRQLTAFAHPGESVWQEANLNEIVARALEVLRFDNRLKPITIEKSLDGRMPRMRLQPSALEQVIINLVINAADAMEQARLAKLSVSTHVSPGEVKLLISDTGCGIPSDVMARIFDPFFTTKPVGKGTGLGLSISYSLVRKHGGDISVDSSPGKGSTFTIRLPIAPHSREGAPAAFVTPENVALK